MYMKMIPPRPLFWATLVVVLNTARLLPVASGQQKPFILIDKSFNIRSRIAPVSAVQEGLPVINEHYSVGQHRARLQFGATRFYYDSKTDVSLRYYPRQRLCYNDTIEVLYNHLFDDRATQMIGLLRVAGRAQDLKYVIGPAKLLFLVAHESNKMVQLNMEDQDKSRWNIRNHQVVKYKLEVQINYTENATVFIFYDKKTHTGMESIRGSIPMQMIIQFPSKQVIIDYFGYELTDDHVKSDLAEHLDLDKGSEVALDLFAFPPSFNCSNFMDLMMPIQLFEQYSFGSSKFSFRATETSSSMRLLQHFVAFDGWLQSMRVDTRQKLSMDEVIENSRVFDYRSNRQYTILSDSSNETIRFTPGDQSSQHCFATYISSPEVSKQRGSLPFAQLLFGADRFVPMGRAKVHGVEAHVFEAYTRNLPYWISQPMLFKNRFGKYGHRLPGFQLSSNPADVTMTGLMSQTSQFNVVVYLADEQPSTDTRGKAVVGPKLLLLEIYSLMVSKSSSERRFLVTKIHSFVWELSDAPNGDSAKDLFKLVDRCSRGSKNDKYIEVDLILEAEEKEAESSQITKPWPAWIREWWRRDAALAVSISDTLRFQANRMYDLESHYVEEPTRSIGVSFRVSEHPQLLYETVFLGLAEVAETGKQTIRRTSVQSIADCFWSVNPTKPVTYFLYSEGSKTCIIDEDFTSFQMSENSKSKELFRIEIINDRDIGADNYLGSRFESLHNRMMVLQNVQTIISYHPVESSDIKVRIRKAKRRKFNFVGPLFDGNDDGAKQVEPASFVYPGFGFHEDSRFTRPAFENDGKPIQSLVRCQAACNMDLECRSFSYCARFPEPQCLLVEVSLESPVVREQLAAKRSQQKIGSSKFKVDIPGGFEVELVRDFRCELRNKIFTDLFKVYWPMQVYYRQRQVVPVDSLERCAEICMNKNLELIKSGMAMTGRLNELLYDDDSPDYHLKYVSVLDNLREQHRKSMKEFCAHFMYLNSALDKERQSFLMRITNTSEPSSEYCLFDSHSMNKITNETTQDYAFQVTSYQFDFTKLYEGVPDVRLTDSDTSKEELEAYSAISHAEKSADKTQFSLIQEALNEGKNFQMTQTTEPNVCAYLCFTQSAGLWPACRSFDVSSSLVTTMCTLNTGLLQDPKTVPVYVNQTNSKLERVWHYEPIFGLVSQQLDNDFKLDYLERRGGPDGLKRTRVTLPGIWLFAITAVGLVSGLVFGVYLARLLDGIFVEGRGSLDDGLADGLVMRSVSNCKLDMDDPSDLDKKERQQQ